MSKSAKTRKFRNAREGWTEWSRKSWLTIENRRVTVEVTLTLFDGESVYQLNADFWTGGKRLDAKWKNPVVAFREISSYIMEIYSLAMSHGHVCYIRSSTPSRQRLYERMLRRHGIKYSYGGFSEEWGTRDLVWNNE